MEAMRDYLNGLVKESASRTPDQVVSTFSHFGAFFGNFCLKASALFQIYSVVRCFFVLVGTVPGCTLCLVKQLRSYDEMYFGRFLLCGLVASDDVSWKTPWPQMTSVLHAFA